MAEDENKNLSRLTKLEKKVDSLDKATDELFGKQEEKISELRDISQGLFSELRNQIQNNAIADLNHYTELKGQLKQTRILLVGFTTRNKEVLRELCCCADLSKESRKMLLKKLDAKDGDSEKVQEYTSHVDKITGVTNYLKKEPTPSKSIISTFTDGKPYFGDSHFEPKEPPFELKYMGEVSRPRVHDEPPEDYVLSADGYTPNLAGKIIVEKAELKQLCGITNERFKKEMRKKYGIDTD